MSGWGLGLWAVMALNCQGGVNWKDIQARVSVNNAMSYIPLEEIKRGEEKGKG